MKLNISFSVHRNEVPEDESVDAGDGKHDGPGGEVAQVLGWNRVIFCFRNPANLTILAMAGTLVSSIWVRFVT